MDEMQTKPDMPGVLTVVQARANSQRLPGKPLLPLGQSTVLEQVIARAQAAGVNGPIIAAVPEGDEDRGLRNFCREMEIPLVTGSENDVLARILRAAQEYEARIVVRCQASHPLLDPKMLWASARYAHDSGMDYVTVARLPLGAAGEAFPVRTLERIAGLTDAPHYREEVTSFTSTRPDLFERAHLPPPPRLSRPELRLCLETEDDYWFLKRIFEEVAPGANGLIALPDIIAHIDADPELRRHSSGGYAVVWQAAA